MPRYIHSDSNRGFLSASRPFLPKLWEGEAEVSGLSGLRSRILLMSSALSLHLSAANNVAWKRWKAWHYW